MAGQDVFNGACHFFAGGPDHFSGDVGKVGMELDGEGRGALREGADFVRIRTVDFKTAQRS